MNPATELLVAVPLAALMTALAALATAAAAYLTALTRRLGEDARHRQRDDPLPGDRTS